MSRLREKLGRQCREIEPRLPEQRRSPPDSLPITRRAYVTLATVLTTSGLGTGVVVGSDNDTDGVIGFGEGAYGAGGFGGIEIDAPPELIQYTTDEGTIDTDGLRDAVSDWRSGEVDTDLLRDVVSYWRSGDPVS